MTMAIALSLATQAVPYAPEERMDFSIEYLGVTMGKARIAVGRPEGGALPVLLLARTSGLVSVVDVREQLSSVLDVETGLPRTFTLDAVEPGYKHTDVARFDRASNKAIVRQKGKYDNTYEIDVPPDTVDFVAMVFRLRTLPLEPGATHDFPVLVGKDVAKVTATVEARETISTPAGKFATVRVRVPTGMTGKFSEKNPTYVWFSDDARRIVVRITTDFAIGRAKAELSGYQPGKPDEAGASGAPPHDRAARR
ncbi:DUF3108 domain-containing protein [Anaeromyxobacter oryzae]|nr:DUF3108 domain-containing protein [Anaeromyxobacter oryzae]